MRCMRATLSVSMACLYSPGEDEVMLRRSVLAGLGFSRALGDWGIRPSSECWRGRATWRRAATGSPPSFSTFSSSSGWVPPRLNGSSTTWESVQNRDSSKSWDKLSSGRLGPGTSGSESERLLSCFPTNWSNQPSSSLSSSSSGWKTTWSSAPKTRPSDDVGNPASSSESSPETPRWLQGCRGQRWTRLRATCYFLSTSYNLHMQV